MLALTPVTLSGAKDLITSEQEPYYDAPSRGKILRAAQDNIHIYRISFNSLKQLIS